MHLLYSIFPPCCIVPPVDVPSMSLEVPSIGVPFMIASVCISELHVHFGNSTRSPESTNKIQGVESSN